MYSLISLYTEPMNNTLHVKAFKNQLLFVCIMGGILFLWFCGYGACHKIKTHEIIEVPLLYKLCKLSTTKIKTMDYPKEQTTKY